MKLKLDFDITEAEEKINLKDRLYLTGSCFSDEMGKKLSIFKFTHLCNPFGTLYHPLSIFKILKGEMELDAITKCQGVFYHWDVHGEVSALTEDLLTETLKKRLSISDNWLKMTDWIFITLGTAFVYRLNTTGKIVANCHKIPAKKFNKELLNVEEIVADFEKTYQKLSSKTRIMLTVSPVRHVKDGLIQNNLSKSILLQAVHQLVMKFDRVSYFPSYEIVIDELRDYRFYNKDLVHPSEAAVDYIWGKFVNTYMDEETQAFIKDWDKVQKAINHKPFHPSSDTHQAFVKETLRKLVKFKKIVDISSEQKFLETQLL